MLNPYLGPAVVAHNILQGFLKIQSKLEKQNIKITFISTASNGSKKIIKLSEMVKVINTKRFPPITLTGEIQAWLMSRELEPPDIVHSHDLYEVFPWIKQRVPTVLTLHGIFWKERLHSRNLYMKLYYWLAEKRLKLYFEKLAGFIAISPYVIKELISKGFNTYKVHLIENPISEEFFKLNKNDNSIILYPAKISPRKNQLTFLKAINLIKREIQDFKIYFTGSGDVKYYKILNNFIQINDIKNVVFLGKVPYSKMLELYSMACVVVLVSYQETQPMAILESMASGTPVLASNIIQNRYIITSGKNGILVDPNNPVDIAEHLKMLIEDNKLRKKLGKNARREAEKRWKADIIAKNLLKLYISLL